MASPVIYDQDWQTRHVHSSVDAPFLRADSRWVTSHLPALTWANARRHLTWMLFCPLVLSFAPLHVSSHTHQALLQQPVCQAQALMLGELQARKLSPVSWSSASWWEVTVVPVALGRITRHHQSRVTPGYPRLLVGAGESLALG